MTPAEPPPTDLSFDEKLSKIQKFLPKGIAEKILSHRDRLEGERKQVTVMFCDMQGFTPLSEKIGPEKAYAIMDQIYEILIRKVHEFDGTVNEMTGDGIMALFGAPIALENAPERALRSSLAIHRGMATFNQRLKQENKNVPPLKMRIGIHAGPVIVGTIGNDLHVEFKAVGDTVNLASRMEGLAEPGTTYTTEATYKLTEGLFRFEALGERKIKGKKKAVNIYRVIASSTRKTRFDVSAERGLTPFVGRESELKLLLDSFKRSKAGRGQAFFVISEAGLGKSRLLYEFRKAVANENLTFLEGRCLSYSRNVAYHPIIDILKSNFDIQESDDDADVRGKVQDGLKILGTDETAILPYILELLSVKESGIDKLYLSSEARKDRIFEALKRIVLRGAENRPLVLAIEDLHWIDRSSEEFSKILLESISGARVLLIFTFRPEFVPSWGKKFPDNQVNLDRLSNQESLLMASHLLAKGELDRELEDFILEKTEGVPFFIEEFIKSLKDMDIIERKADRYHLAKNIQILAIPSTIHDVIMARVDSLPADAKDVLQTGSVIEREFSYALIRQVTNLPEQKLLSLLSILKDSELLYERGIYPQSEYIFKHALTREVVYESILTKGKKQLHGEIGDVIEKLYKENLVEYYGVLAEHYIANENYEKGAEYLKLAEQKAEKTGSLNDAITFANKRISALEKLPQTDDVAKKIIDARTVLGLYFAQMNYWVEAKIAVDPIIDLALVRGYKKRLSQIYTIIGTFNFMVEEDFPKAFKHLETSLRISEEINDNVTLLFANFWLGSALALDCKFEKAFNNLNKAININLAVNNLWGTSMIKSVLSVFVCYFRGRANAAHQTSDDAVRIAEQSGDIVSKSWAYVCHGICCYGKGFLEEAAKHLFKGAHFCEKINLFHCHALAQNCLGEIYFEGGEYQNSKNHFEKAIWLVEHNKSSPTWMNLNKIALATAKVMNDEKEIDLGSLYAHVVENNVKMYEGLMRRYVAEILLNIDDRHFREAEDWIHKAIEADQRNGTMLNLGRDYALYTQLFKRRGDRSKARENLMKAIEIYRKCDADGWVQQARRELELLS